MNDQPAHWPDQNACTVASAPPEHPAGCSFGGFSCGYWLVSDGCELEHWETHYVQEHDHCPCGVLFPGAGGSQVFFDATGPD